MQANIRILAKSDILDAEAFKNMMESEGFIRYEARVERLLMSAQLSLETEKDIHNIGQLQGVIRILRLVLKLPEDMKKELSQKIRA